MVHTRNHYNS
jgi:hypothetical protein